MRPAISIPAAPKDACRADPTAHTSPLPSSTHPRTRLTAARPAHRRLPRPSAGIIGVQIFNGGLAHECAVLYNPRPECAGCGSAGALGPGDLDIGGITGRVPIYDNMTARMLYGAGARATPPSSVRWVLLL